MAASESDDVHFLWKVQDEAAPVQAGRMSWQIPKQTSSYLGITRRPF